MFRIFVDWFSQGLSLPLICVDLTLFFAGLMMGLKIYKTKTVTIVMLIMIPVYLFAVLASVCGFFVVETFAVYLGAIAVLLFAGLLTALVYRKIKKK